MGIDSNRDLNPRAGIAEHREELARRRVAREETNEIKSPENGEFVVLGTDPLRVADLQRFIFQTESNEYTLERDVDGSYSLYSKNKNGSVILETSEVENLSIQRGVRFGYGKGHTTPVASGDGVLLKK